MKFQLPQSCCGVWIIKTEHRLMNEGEKVNFRSQILVRPSIGEYWNTFGVPVLPENVIFTFFGMCWCYSEAYNTGTQKWFSIVQYSCTSIRDFKYTFSNEGIRRNIMVARDIGFVWLYHYLWILWLTSFFLLWWCYVCSSFEF